MKALTIIVESGFLNERSIYRTVLLSVVAMKEYNG